ncbi:MAG: tRNA uridine-5-carboxymethylaminomethyl(34) synthesis GTPase MnmE [Myxococcota bacterium]
MDGLKDTIVARATGPAMAAVAVVRLSGAAARSIAETIAGAELGLPHQLALRTLRDGAGRVLDRGLVAFMPGPGSYTGEDVVELQLHGSPVVVAGVVDRCLELGARSAGPGEFTERAFLNGRLDLAQAEGVADLIASENAAQARSAEEVLAGRLSEAIAACLDPLEKVVSDWRAALDFPEYPTDAGADQAREAVLDAALDRVDTLIAGARIRSQRARSVVVCGPPNAGKSTLVNAWAGEKRVLVHEAPGTTRDPVEVPMQGGLRWSVWDTAGIRRDAGEVEAEGIGMAEARIANADLAVWLVPADAPVWPENWKGWVVISRADVGPAQELARDGERRGFRVRGVVRADAPAGLRALYEAVVKAMQVEADDSVLVTRERQLSALRAARSAIAETREGLGQGLTLDVLTGLLEAAVHALGRVLGRDVESAILDRIFQDFCIGK